MLISLAYLIILALVLASLSAKLHLPRLVGMMAAGIILGPYVLNLIDPNLLVIAPDIRQIALIIILLRAGLSLDMKDLKKVGRPALLLSFVPATFEIIGVIVFATWLLGFTWLEAALLGSILAAVSPAVVVPRMLDMIKKGEGTHLSIPQMIMAGASMDDVYVIVLFTSLVTTSLGGTVTWFTLLDLLISIATGIAVGIGVGLGAAYFFNHFHNRDTTKVITLLALSLLLVGSNPWISQWIPYSGLLSVLSMAMTYFALAPAASNRLVLKFEKIWVFAEILLFVFVGAVVDIQLIPAIGLASLGVLLGSLLFRLIGVFTSVLGTKLSFKQRLFVALSYIPKATVQASIGAIPLSLGINNGQSMLIIAVFAILVTAPLGAFLIDHTKAMLGITPPQKVLH